MISYSAEHSLKQEPLANKVMQSLINIPTVFERSRNDSAEDLLVAQAVRQNVKATMQLPLNTLEWARLILKSSGQTISMRNKDQLITCFQRLTKKYDTNPEVSAYDNVSTPAKRQRRGRSSKATASQAVGGTAEEPSVDRIKMSSRRLSAIKNLLYHCSPKTFDQLEVHLVWVGDYALSVITDIVLNEKFSWPKSVLPAADEDALSREIAARAARPPHGATVKPMFYESPLSTEEHELIFAKAIAIFEDNVLHLADLNDWRKHKPTEAEWKTYRIVIQHWSQTIKLCCQKDLTPADYEDIEKAVLFGDALDKQILTIAQRCPHSFTVNMIPELRVSGSMAVDEDTDVTEAIAAENAKWEAEVRILTHNLGIDWKLIKEVQGGAKVFLLACLLACLPACLLACLLCCMPACLPACLPDCLLACQPRHCKTSSIGTTLAMPVPKASWARPL